MRNNNGERKKFSLLQKNERPVVPNSEKAASDGQVKVRK
jgi:hypothetical protein